MTICRTSLVLALLLLGSAHARAPQSGVYWDPSHPGMGFAIEVHAQGAFVIAFTYGSDGSPGWYAGYATLDEGELTVSLDNYAEGPCLSCSDLSGAPQPTSALTAHIRFTGDAQAEMTVEETGQVLALERFPLAYAVSEGTIAGATFVLPDLSGRWLFASIHDDSLHLVLDLELAFSGVSDSGVAFFVSEDRAYGLTCGQTIEGRLRCELRSGDIATLGELLFVAEEPDLSHERMVSAEAIAVRLP